MARVVPESDWVGRMIGLTVQPEGTAEVDPVVLARTRVARLAALAWAVDAAPHHSVAADAFTRWEGGTQARAVCTELVDALPFPQGVERPRIDLQGDALVRAYLDAVRDAASAVSHCRRVEHPGGSCWFSDDGPSSDLCGRLLSVTHRLGERSEGSARPR